MSPPPVLPIPETKRTQARPTVDGGATPLPLPKLTLPQMLEETANKLPERTALIFFGMKVSYSKLLEHVNRCAAGLQALGVRKGDRVALMMPNCPQFIISYFGVLKSGGIVTA